MYYCRLLFGASIDTLISRAVCQLFDELRMIEDAEFSVRVSLVYSVKRKKSMNIFFVLCQISFLELYNEELFDLLSPADDTNRLRLYEDSTRKGSVIIQGLEEVQVKGKLQHLISGTSLTEFG